MEYAVLGAFVGANFLAALSGAIFPPGAWYATLAKPAWRPPDWLFGPAWSVLYTANAVAGWLVWKADGGTAPLVVYGVSLVFNAGWSAIFFGLRRMDWAFYWLIGLWLSVAATILAFAPHSQTAVWLLAPYLAWVTFAGALNRAIWRLNAGARSGDFGG
ncbi:MAG: tryptophan-rich sensory protein [Azospirillum sp.]|nr:tryptophan-rich sensory protein [Azospirillum sp.]MCA3265212.1 tryptophan-rich sensory protein [Azospirillum sp.]MCZ8123495.1 tryptophan-rich sensory protein [Magnetospirillum sp.]